MNRNSLKVGSLLRMAVHHPREFSDRLATFLEHKLGQARGPSQTPAVLFPELQERLSLVLADLTSYFLERELAEIEQSMTEVATAIHHNIEPYHAADPTLARLCYALCRALRPNVVVETGVAHGVTSAFILQALAVNGNGELWSIDMPPLAASDDEVGRLVPSNLRAPWHLLRGRSRRLLPKLVAKLSSVDMFLHDSLHTYRNMKFEFETVWPKLKPGGILIADDANFNCAFEDFVAQNAVALALNVQQETKQATFGTIVKASA